MHMNMFDNSWQVYFSDFSQINLPIKFNRDLCYFTATQKLNPTTVLYLYKCKIVRLWKQNRLTKLKTKITGRFNAQRFGVITTPLSRENQ